MENDLRRWMRLVEQQTRWPSSVTPTQLIGLITWDDVGDGDIPYDMMKFVKYDLRAVPVARMTADWELRNPKNIEAYAQRMRNGEVSPPVVYDSVSDILIDGAHRLAAAKLAGLKTLPAYVGTEDNLDPEWEDMG